VIESDNVGGQGPPDPHEGIEELLAAHTLGALDGAEALEAERLLSEHVPECDRCRQTLAELQDVASELALAAPAAAPPDLLFSRLHREIRQQPAGKRRPIASWIGTAAAIAVLGLGVWNAVLNSRLSHETESKQRFADTIRQISLPGYRTVSFDTQREVAAHMKAAFRPGDAHVVLFGADVPEPTGGNVYRLWLGSHGNFQPVRTFVPEDGIVVLPFLIDLSRYDQIMVTEESANDAPTQPSGKRRWSVFIRVG
jgi:anti-sigma-K factor RskA